MPYQVEELEDSSRFRQLLKIPYDEILSFVLGYIRKRTAITVIFWLSCIIFFIIAVYIRVSIAGSYNFPLPLIHSILGLIALPVLIIPVHEVLHIVPYFLSGARDIRAGMDLKQYLFYVTAHRYVASDRDFKIVAAFPYLLISSALLLLIFFLPGLWKWSLSLTLFIHATMCAGDFALLNFLYLNRSKKIYTWDDADKKEAYFYEKL